MRKNSVRKWLHAILDLLPLFVIPIFAIYTRNENYNSNIEVQIENNLQVDFNQRALFKTNTGGGFTNDYSKITSNRSTTIYPQFVDYTFIDNHIYVLHPYVLSGNTSSFQVYYFGNTLIGNIQNDTYLQFTFDETKENIFLAYSGDTNTETYFNLFDLTQMFGVGNEPSLNDFISYYSNNTYPYTTSHYELISNYLITYNDTDVGSQFIYTLYNATDKYFNCTNLFNLQQVWNWVQLNLFSGNAPLMVYVVWQVIVYEFFMDLIFLLYSVFMFVIDFATNTLERFYRRSC